MQNRFSFRHSMVLALIFFSGCAAYYPQAVDIPLIKEKGDIRVDAGYFVAPSFFHEEEGGLMLGGHGTFSIGVTNMVAVQAYANVDIFGRFHIQGATGLFKSFENNTVIELYGGFGGGFGYWGNIVHTDTRYNCYNLTFSQFNIGKTGIGKRNIDYGLGLKGGYIHSHYGEGYNPEYMYQKNGWIVEPSVFFRFGSKRVKFCTKVNYLWTETISENYYFPLMVSMGVNFSLGKSSKSQ